MFPEWLTHCQKGLKNLQQCDEKIWYIFTFFISPKHLFPATHAYSGKAEYDRVYLDGLYQRYGKKIWFTEFALPSTKNLEDEMNYMREILPYLESSDAIWRYSWFVQRWPREGSGNVWYLDRVISLLEEDSSALTELGEYYNEF